MSGTIAIKSECKGIQLASDMLRGNLIEHLTERSLELFEHIDKRLLNIWNTCGQQDKIRDHRRDLIKRQVEELKQAVEQMKVPEGCLHAEVLESALTFFDQGLTNILNANHM